MNIFIDLETIPSSRPDVHERLHAELVPKTANGHPLKDEAKIAAWWKNEADDAYNKALHATGLDGGLGEIVCICAAADDDEVWTWERSHGIGERALLVHFFDWLAETTSIGDHGSQRKWEIFVGANVAAFDIKFLWKRAVVLGVKPTVRLPHNDKPWKDTYIDILSMWYGDGWRKQGETLGRICEALSIDVDDEIDGSQVWERWQAGDIDTIVQHCRADVERVRECYKRMMFS